MKLLKSFFAAAIAVLAISATVAAHAGAFEVKRVADCYTLLNIPSTPAPTGYTNINPKLEGQVTNWTAINAPVGKLAVPVVDATHPLIDLEVECFGTGKFCCAKVEFVAAISQYRVTQVAQRL
ncbi:hypothetical protein LX64_00325 [Chitinophaga skermanii]|uniref:Uncharacterized protein n=1 Tax=Chitinophaga skermanii TaxID=331697 RepID=A0A327R1J1_9BACT|nr:hypothetical protein [Chitinophaga skermanii]RAJ10719.1 hypothetical protein LX64_00325 [Chitinophaga skermanii]